MIKPSVQVIPIFNKESECKFVSVDQIEPKEVKINNEVFLTSALAFDKELTLLGISQSDSMLESGYVKSTDQLEDNIKLEKIYLQNKDEVFFIDVSNQPGAVARQKPDGAFKTAYIDFQSKPLVFLVPNKYTEPYVKAEVMVKVSGRINLELSDILLHAELVNGIEELKAIGYEISAFRKSETK